LNPPVAMFKLQFNPLVIETFGRLHGALAFLETMNAGIPALEEKQHRYLEQLAKDGGWDYGDYTAERDTLDHDFHTWIPIFVAYSVTVLLYSIVETQLCAFAEYVGKNSGSKLRVEDMAGKGIERSALYLKRGLSIDVKTDPAWSRLKDLQSLRNIIVHRGGKPSQSQEHQKAMDSLIGKYPKALDLRNTNGFHEQIWMSMSLCRDFAQHIGECFERVFVASGLPNRHGILPSRTDNAP
jgi:hypothetical protein